MTAAGTEMQNVQNFCVLFVKSILNAGVGARGHPGSTALAFSDPERSPAPSAQAAFDLYF